MDYLSLSRSKWKKPHYMAYAKELESRLEREDVNSQIRAYVSREKEQTALIEQLKAEHQSELQQVRDSLVGANKKLRDDREKLLAALNEPAAKRARVESSGPSMSQAQLSVACRALNTMWLNERDEMLAEKDVKIRELQEQVQSLRRGDGPIGEVLVHNWPSASATTKALLLKETRPVNETLKHLVRVLDACKDVCTIGGVSSVYSDTVRASLEGLVRQ